MPEVIDAMTTIESVGTDFTPETTDPQNELGEAITNLWSAHLRLPGWVLSYRLIVQFSAQIGSTGAILRCIGYGYGASRDVFPLYRQINFVREFLSLCLIRNTNNASLGRPRVLGSEAINMDDVVGRSLQVWLVASTIIATVSFVLVGWKNRRATLPAGSFKFEGILLLSWWVIVVGACVYGFALGMGG